MNGISQSQVYRFCDEINRKVKVILEQPIEGDWLYICIDNT